MLKSNYNLILIAISYVCISNIYQSVEEDGLVKGGHERVDGILVVSVIKLVPGYALHFVAEFAVLLRVRNAGGNCQ